MECGILAQMGYAIRHVKIKNDCESFFIYNSFGISPFSQLIQYSDLSRYNFKNVDVKCISLAIAPVYVYGFKEISSELIVGFPSTFDINSNPTFNLL